MATQNSVALLQVVALPRGRKQRAVVLGVPLVTLVEKFVRQGLRRGSVKALRDRGRRDKIRDMDM